MYYLRPGQINKHRDLQDHRILQRDGRVRLKKTLLIGTLATLSLALVPGCQQVRKAAENVGGEELAGGAGGGGLGYVLADSADASTEVKIAATVGGALAGAWLADQLTEEDQKKRKENTEKAIATNEPQKWENPETGVSGETKVTQRTTSEGTADVSVDKGRVEEVPPLELIGEPYKTTHETVVRGGPGQEYTALETVSAGTGYNVQGKVEGKPWYMVADPSGVARGFVRTGSMRALEGKKLEAPPEKNAGGDEAEVETRTVRAERQCRTVHERVELGDGTVEEREVTYCKNADGTWVAQE